MQAMMSKVFSGNKVQTSLKLTSAALAVLAVVAPSLGISPSTVSPIWPM